MKTLLLALIVANVVFGVVSQLRRIQKPVNRTERTPASNRTPKYNTSNRSSSTTSSDTPVKSVTSSNQVKVLSFGQISYKLVSFSSAVKQIKETGTSSGSGQTGSTWQYIANKLPKSTLKKKSSPPLKTVSQERKSTYSYSLTPNKDEVRTEVLSWWTEPIGDNLIQSINVVSEAVTFENETTKCVTKKVEYSLPSYLTMNIDQPTSTLYPGGFVQGKSIKTGAQPLVRLPVSSNQRFDIQISSINGYQGDAFPSSDSVMELIRMALEVQQNDVWIGFVESKDLQVAFEAMNFNSRVAEKLGITSSKTERIYVFMQQLINEYYPAMVVKDESFIEDPIGVFLQDSFDIRKALAFKNLLYWGEKNIPCYISRVYFGRFLAVSVEANKKNREIYESIASSSLGTAETTQRLNQMFKGPGALAYGKNLFSEVETELIQSGNWSSFFGDIEIKPQNVEKLSPLVYSINDFRDQPVQFSNAITYPLTQCVAKPKPPQNKVFVQLVNVYDYAYLQVKPSGKGFYTVHEMGQGSSTVMDISGHLTNDPQATDEIRIINLVEKKCWLCQYHREVILQVWFDTVDDAHRAYSDQQLCTACHSSDDAIRCNINKVKRTINCWKS